MDGEKNWNTVEGCFTFSRPADEKPVAAETQMSKSEKPKTELGKNQSTSRNLCYAAYGERLRKELRTKLRLFQNKSTWLKNF